MSTFELIDNIFQLIVTLFVGTYASILAIKTPKFLQLQYLAGASICWFVGTIYWTIYFVIYGDFPYYFSASELCYLGVYLFFIGACRLNIEKDMVKALTRKQRLCALILPIFAVSINTLSFIMYGGLLWHLYYVIPQTMLAYLSLRNIFLIKCRPLYKFNLSIVCFTIANCLMFLVSCFGWNYLYILFDFMLTLTFLSMLFYLKKESEL